MSFSGSVQCSSMGMNPQAHNTCLQSQSLQSCGSERAFHSCDLILALFNHFCFRFQIARCDRLVNLIKSVHQESWGQAKEEHSGGVTQPSTSFLPLDKPRSLLPFSHHEQQPARSHQQKTNELIGRSFSLLPIPTHTKSSTFAFCSCTTSNLTDSFACEYPLGNHWNTPTYHL